MTMLAAKVFRMSLLDRLEAPHGGNLAACASADVLARESRDGVAGLLRELEDEASDANERGRVHAFSLCETLMSVWTARGDDQHLKNATGKTRQEWLDAPLWAFAN